MVKAVTKVHPVQGEGHRPYHPMGGVSRSHCKKSVSDGTHCYGYLWKIQPPTLGQMQSQWRFLEPGWRKKKKKKSKILPDFKVEKRIQKGRLVWGKRLFQKMFPVALPFESGEDPSMFIGRDNGAKRKSKDRK